MADVVDPATRSRMMRGIRGKDTQPELRVRRRLHSAGLRYRLQAKELPGRPDIVFRPIRTAVFVHGCFWHQHADCPFATEPKSNAGFWKAKLATNVTRDRKAFERLTELGWVVETVWECDGDDKVQCLIERLQANRKSLDCAVRRGGPGAHNVADGLGIKAPGCM